MSIVQKILKSLGVAKSWGMIKNGHRTPHRLTIGEPGAPATHPVPFPGWRGGRAHPLLARGAMHMPIWAR